MIITDPNIVKDLKAGIANPVEVEKWLLNNCSAPALAHELAGFLINQEATKPIVVSAEQFTKFFRVQGWKFQDNQWVPETRGKFSKKDL